MPSPRRLILSLRLLPAFDAVCRTRSKPVTPRDLDQSQGAVSRLIRNLQGQLGLILFLRDQRRLMPTKAALPCRRDVVKALDLSTRGDLRLRSGAG